jgi:hypothetical protein
MSAIKSLRRRLKNDVTWKSFRAIRKKAWRPEFENFGDELLRLHKTRGIRSLGSGRRASKLGDAALQDQAVRSRAVEIVITLMESRDTLEVALHNTFKHIEATYTRLLVDRDVKTKMEQKSIIESCFSSARSTMKQINSLIDIADRIIDDIDQGGFAIKHSLEALAIATKREHHA